MGGELPFDALLLATGAEPIRLTIAGAADQQVCYLRSSPTAARSSRGPQRPGARSSSARASSGWRSPPRCGRAASRSTSSRRKRVPLERVLGPELGRFVQALHEEHGVIFHLGNTRRARASTRSGHARRAGVLEADLVVAGVGVRPALALAEAAGLAIDRGVVGRRVPAAPAPPVCSRPATSRAGPIRISGERSASSTGWWPSVRARRPRATCSARARAVRRRRRSSGASTTTSRSTTWVMPSVGTRIEIDGTPAARDCAFRYRARRAHARGGDHRPRPREPAGGAGDGGSWR